MGHHHRIVAHSFSFSVTPYGVPSDPFHPLVNLSADPCGCLGPSTPSADAAAGRGLGLCSAALLYGLAFIGSAAGPEPRALWVKSKQHNTFLSDLCFNKDEE